MMQTSILQGERTGAVSTLPKANPITSLESEHLM